MSERPYYEVLVKFRFFPYGAHDYKYIGQLKISHIMRSEDFAAKLHLMLLDLLPDAIERLTVMLMEDDRRDTVAFLSLEDNNQNTVKPRFLPQG